MEILLLQFIHISRPASDFVLSERLTFVHLSYFDLINLTEVSFESNIIRADTGVCGYNTPHVLVVVVSDKGSGAVVHDRVVVILLTVSHCPSVGGELSVVLSWDIVPLNLKSEEN